jgi:glycosyltransferase involved in cell wall biosynthesis
MRVVLIDPLSYTPPYDHQLARALAARGHAVELIAGPFLHGDAPEPNGYERNELFASQAGRLRAAPRSLLSRAVKALGYMPSVGRMLGHIDHTRPHVVHVQWLPRPELDRHWVRRLSRSHATVFTAHDVVPRRPGALPRWADTLNLFDRVVVHSGRGEKRLAELGVAAEKLRRIGHPVFDAVDPGPPEGRTLLFFGLIREYKGLDVLVRALAQIPDARLVVAGDPLDSVEPVRRLAEEIGVDGRVEWRLGFRPDEEVARLMSEATAVVLPYRQLDSSGVLATAIGYRRPVVTTDVGSLGEIVRDYCAGLVVRPGDADELAAACARLLSDRGELGRAYHGSRAAAEALTWEASAAAHERLYEEIARS